MKYLFLIILILLVVASIGIYLSMPAAKSDVPVLYWVTDGNPARKQQIEIFHQWMIKRGYTTDDGRPACEMRIDVINRDRSKMVIQGLSGMGGDILDAVPGDMPYFQALGLLEDVTELGLRLGFDPSHTYKAIESDLCIDGRQYAFPCNVYVHMYWVNVETFRRYGLKPPPRRWTFDEFEERGREFVQKANSPGKPRTAFFTNNVDIRVLMRSMGLSIYNETLTRCTLDDPRAARCAERLYKWIYEDHLIPTKAESDSFAATSDYGGLDMHLFHSGQYAMIKYGRYGLIRFRQFGEMELVVVESPHGGFPVAETGTRAACIYHGGKYKDLAAYFLEYLASEDYNMQIVRDADALPPNPEYTRCEAFLRPSSFPGEEGCHEVFAEAAKNIAISKAYSPFILGSVADRYLFKAYDRVMNRLANAEAAFQQTTKLINKTIDRNINEDDSLKQRYDRLMARQKEIDILKANHQKIPAQLIENPFHKRYYESLGLLE